MSPKDTDIVTETEGSTSKKIFKSVERPSMLSNHMQSPIKINTRGLESSKDGYSLRRGSS